VVLVKFQFFFFKKELEVARGKKMYGKLPFLNFPYIEKVILKLEVIHSTCGDAVFSIKATVFHRTFHRNKK